nr:HlyD family type I secretion periplasmic adaptor subunit [Desulfohalobium retbaense]
MMTRKRRKAVAPKTSELDFLHVGDAAIHRKGYRSAYVLSAAIILCICALIAWAHFAILDEVTRGVGKVVSSRRTQVIQNLEGGIIEDILVDENQLVDEGDVLVRLSNVTAVSQVQDAYHQSLQHRAAIARLQAEVQGKEPEFSEELLREAPDIVEDQRAIYEARKRQLEQEVRVLRSQYTQKLQEVAEMKSRKKQMEANLAVALEQRDIAEPLVKKQIYPRVEFLQLEREIISLRGNLETLELSIPRANNAAIEVRERLEQRRAEFEAAALEEMNRQRVQFNSLQELLTAGEDRVQRTDVRSPVRGTIKQLLVNTIGGVIQPGEPIMEIVPVDDTLLVEASIRPADIAFIHPGQKAMIKVSAYDFSIYGGLEGVVEQISADTLSNEEGESFYKVKLRTRTNALTYRGNTLPIIPGMTATVDVLTGKKSVLDYLLKPIFKAKQNALRER